MARRASTALRAMFRAERFPSASYGLTEPRPEHRLLEISLGQKFLEADVFLRQLGQTIGLLSLHSSVLQLPAVIARLGNLNGTAEIRNDLALRDQLLSGFDLAYNQLPVWRIRFIVKSPGKSGRVRLSFTLVRRHGATSGVRRLDDTAVGACCRNRGLLLGQVER